MKVIFLDVFNVFSSVSLQERRFEEGFYSEFSDEGAWVNIDEKIVQSIAGLCKDKKIKLVAINTKIDSLEQLVSELNNIVFKLLWPLIPYIEGVIPNNGNREAELIKYLENSKNIEKYLIIDSDNTFMTNYSRIIYDYQEGITIDHLIDIEHHLGLN